METKLWYQSKTIWVNIISIVLAFLQMNEIVTLIPPQYNGLLGAIVATLNLALRFATTTAVAATEASRERFQSLRGRV